MVEMGMIKYYVVAVWNGFIDESTNEHLNLEDLVDIAIKVGGDNHNFKYIQTPI